MQPTRLNLPAKKFFVKDLQQVLQKENSSTIANLLVWSAKPLGLYPEFSIVWIQGRIADIIKTGAETDEFTVNDGTAVIHVTRPSAVPSGCAAFKKGLYVMVVGELQSSGPRPVVKAMKIQDLSEENVASTMWDIEVKDMYRFCT